MRSEDAKRPTQKAMGSGAVRSQMDVRICLRVRERRDVDLILGQGMLTAGWAADTLNAPGKFLDLHPGTHHPAARPRLPCRRPRRRRHRRPPRRRPAAARRRSPATPSSRRRRARATRPTTPPVDLGRPRGRALDRPARRARERPLGPRADDRHRDGPHLGLRPAPGTRRRRPRHPDQPRPLDRHRPESPSERVVRADVRDARTPIRAGARDGRTSARTFRRPAPGREGRHGAASDGHGDSSAWQRQRPTPMSRRERCAATSPRVRLTGYRVGPRLLKVDLNDLDRLARPIPTARG